MYATKTVPAGEGGIVITNDEELALMLKKLLFMTDLIKNKKLELILEYQNYKLYFLFVCVKKLKILF